MKNSINFKSVSSLVPVVLTLAALSTACNQDPEKPKNEPTTTIQVDSRANVFNCFDKCDCRPDNPQACSEELYCDQKTAVCMPKGTTCGDGTCEGPESTKNCPGDCE